MLCHFPSSGFKRTPRILAVSDQCLLQYPVQPFETEIVCMPVCKLSLAETDDDADTETLRQFTAAWREKGIWLVSCRLSDDRVGAIERLTDAGFRPIENLVTFERRIDGDETVSDVELATGDDIAACIEISNGAFTHDRLHRDPLVPDTVADNVRRAWIRNNMNGRADASFVIRRDGDVAGFNLCLFDGDTAVIDLIAVSPAFQKMNIGTRLVMGALNHYRGRASRVRVGTQTENLASIALYKKAGFAAVQQQTTLHWVNPDVTPDTA